MIDAYHELLEDLSTTPNIIQDLIAGVEAPPAGRAGEWGAVEILAHLADTERMMRGRMMLMLSQQTPYLRRFDQEAAAREGRYAERELRPTFEEFATERAETVSTLINLALKHWERTGIHDELGEVSIEDLAERLIQHDAEHLDQLRRALAG